MQAIYSLSISSKDQICRYTFIVKLCVYLCNICETSESISLGSHHVIFLLLRRLKKTLLLLQYGILKLMVWRQFVGQVSYGEGRGPNSLTHELRNFPLSGRN